MRETGGRPLIATVQRYLAAREMLLILDNFERVLDAAPAWPAAVRGARVTVLVTSRAPLRLRASRSTWHPPRPARAGNYRRLICLLAVRSGRLFVDRVQAVRPDFT